MVRFTMRFDVFPNPFKTSTQTMIAWLGQEGVVEGLSKRLRTRGKHQHKYFKDIGHSLQQLLPMLFTNFPLYTDLGAFWVRGQCFGSILRSWPMLFKIQGKQRH